MMKSQPIRLAGCLLAAILLMSPHTWALSTGSLQAQVPFSFYVVGQLLPAGNYVISCLTHGGAIKIQSQDSAEFAIVLTMPTSAGKNSQSYLTFYRYGSDHFLRGIQSGDPTLRGALWKTSKEKEIAAKTSKSPSGDKRLAGPVLVTVQLHGE